MSALSPCMGCDARTITCHGSCKAYAQFREALNEQKQARYKANDTDDYIIKRVYKRRSMSRIRKEF